MDNSNTLYGCVLDSPNNDPDVEELHKVYSTSRKEIFTLSKDVYNNVIRVLFHNRPNDLHRIAKQVMSFGDCISFQYNKDNQIVSFKKEVSHVHTEFVDSKPLFTSSCVFNKILTEVYSEDFGYFKIKKKEILNLNNIPNPYVVLKCHLDWTIKEQKLIPNVYKIVGVDIENQDLATQTKWIFDSAPQSCIKYNYESENDDGIELETNKTKKEDTNRQIKGESFDGFVTSLTSVYIPSLFGESVILPWYNLNVNSVGRILTECKCVYNPFLNCYVVFASKNTRSTPYITMLEKHEDMIEALVYVNIDVTEYSNGFYKHSYFKMIADPFGFLDITRFDSEKKRIYRVPIKDRLANTDGCRNLQNLDIITRFEIASSGDNPDQLDLIEEFRNKKASLTGGGVVVDAKNGTMCAQNFTGIIFRLPLDHPYQNGDMVILNAVRINDKDLPRPTFSIIKHKKRSKTEKQSQYCVFGDGKFKLEAKFNSKLNCYEALSIFGPIPCRKPPPSTKVTKLKSGEPIQQIYEITAELNTNLSGQTALFHGEFVRELRTNMGNYKC